MKTKKTQYCVCTVKFQVTLDCSVTVCNIGSYLEPPRMPVVLGLQCKTPFMQLMCCYFAAMYCSDLVIDCLIDVQVFDRDGIFKFHFGACGKHDGQLLYPNRVAVCRVTGDIVVTERSPTHQVARCAH